MTRSGSASLLMLAAALVTAAATPSEPEREALPSPAPRTAAPAGRVLFQDDFNGESLARWTSDRAGVWSVRRGMLRGDLPDRKQEHSIISAGDSAWTDIALDVDVCAMRGVDKGVVVRLEASQRAVGVDLRGPGYEDVVVHVREWPLAKVRAVNANGMWHHLRVEARGQRFLVSVDGALAVDRTDKHRAGARGRIGLAAYTGGTGQCTVYFDNVVVTESP